MSARIVIAARLVAVATAMALLTSGCVYDYLNHTDRVAYSAGDAVHYNLEQETIDPVKASMRYKGGLGKNGLVVPKTTTATTTTTGSSGAGTSLTTGN